MSAAGGSAPRDVIVVGGGFAGVAAARELRQAGRSVVILEARDRVGGRTYTTTRGGQLVELGGAFVHWWQGQSITEVQRYRLDVEYVPFLADRCFWPAGDGPIAGTAEDLNAVAAKLLDTFMSDARDVFPRPFEPLFREERVRALDGLSVSDRLDELDFDPAERQLLAGILCSLSSGTTADVGLLAPLRWLSMHRWNSIQFMEREHYRIVGGIGRLIQAMLDDANCEVRLESPVATVAQSNGGATVTLRDGTEEHARTVVLAVPASALRTIDLPADAPPAWRDLAERGAGSRGLKLVMKAPAGTPSVFAVGPESAPITWLITERETADATHLVGFGPDGDRIDGDDLAAVRAAVHAIAPGVDITEAQHHDWCGDEFSQGTWGFLRPGQLSTLPDLTRPHGSVVLAGADVASSWPSFVSGAIESGIRAARDVDRLLNGATIGAAA